MPLRHAIRWGGGGCTLGRGGRSCQGGRPASLVLPHSLVSIAWDGRARPSPACLLVRGLGLQRRWVSPAIAPEGEGGAQGPGEPVAGLRNRGAEHRPSLQDSRPRRLLARPPRPNHGPEDPLVVLRGRPTPRGHLPFPLLLRRSTASRRRFFIPLVVPEEAQLTHLYTSTNRGRASLFRGSGTASQSRCPGQAPSAPRAGSSCGPRACGAGAAPCPPAAGAAAIRACSALVSGAAGGAS